MKKLFLDDIRTVDMVYDLSMIGEFEVVRSYDAFVDYIQAHGLPDFISFDNDLGEDEAGNLLTKHFGTLLFLNVNIFVEQMTSVYIY